MDILDGRILTQIGAILDGTELKVRIRKNPRLLIQSVKYALHTY